MSVAYVRIYTQQSIFFHELSLDHQNYNIEAFSRLSVLLIADKTNTNSCQAWILVNFTNVAPAHSSIQYHQIFSYHLIEETYSYPHVWIFPETMLKYLYGGTFEKCKLFFDTHCSLFSFLSNILIFFYCSILHIQAQYGVGSKQLMMFVLIVRIFWMPDQF